MLEKKMKRKLKPKMKRKKKWIKDEKTEMKKKK